MPGGRIDASTRTSFSAPPFTGAVAGGTAVCIGRGGVDSIQWNTPVAFLFADATVARFDFAATDSHRYVVGIRNVSPQGITEHSTHVIAFMEWNDDGLTDAFLPRPRTPAIISADDMLVIGFTCPVPPGHAQPDTFELLTDGGTGVFNDDSPLASISALTESADISISLEMPTVPCQIAVRACRDGLHGPMSRPLPISPPRLIPVPDVLRIP
jgi:hypothetical protein